MQSRSRALRMRVFLPLLLALRGVVADLSSDTLNAVVQNMNKSSTQRFVSLFLLSYCCEMAWLILSSFP